MESAIQDQRSQLPEQLRHSVKVCESKFQELFRSSPLLSLHARFVFETQGKIGEGGMGSVYQVKDHRLKRIAALKLLSDKNATEYARLRFLREAEITAGLDHPAIPPVYETGLTADGDLYMLMRMIRGKTLREVIKECHELGSMERRELIEIMIKVAEAVAYAHSQGVIHRDLKPDNIMVGEFGEVLVIDWGIAKDLKVIESTQTDKILECVLSKSELEQVGVTVSGTMVGTPGYMAPEQIDGVSIDERADVFALGLILVEILTGKRAISGDTTLNLVTATASGAARSPKELDSSLSREIDWIARETLELDPDLRTQSADDLVAQLRAYLNGDEIPGYCYSLIERAQRTIRRRPGLIVAMAAGALLFALIGNLWLTLELEGQKRKEAEKDVVVAKTKLGVAEDEAERAKAVLTLLNEARNLVERGAPKKHLTEKIAEALKRGGRTENQLLTAARIYSEANFDEDSKALLEEAVKRFPPCYEGLFALHTQEMKLANRGFYETSYLIKMVAESEKRGDENEYTLFGDAVRLDELGRLDESIAAYTRIEDYSTNFLYMYVNRGVAWKKKGALDKALADFNKALRLNARSEYALVNRGMLWKRRGEYEKALTDFNRAIKYNPRLAPAYSGRGQIWEKREELERALVDFNKALQLNPRSDFALTNRGNIWRKMGELDKAHTDYNKALQLNPSSDFALTHRGTLWSKRGEFEKSLIDYNRALGINPENSSAYYKRGILWSKRGKFDNALADFDKAIEFDSQFALAFSNRGAAWSEKGDFDKAIADLNRGIEIDPRSSLAFVYRGTVWGRKGDLDKALADFTKAIDVDPRGPSAFYHRGVVWTRKKRKERALADLTKAIEFKHKDPYVYFFRGYLYALLKQPKAASVDYETFLSLAPNHPEAANAKKLLAQVKAQR